MYMHMLFRFVFILKKKQPYITVAALQTNVFFSSFNIHFRILSAMNCRQFHSNIDNNTIPINLLNTMNDIDMRINPSSTWDVYFRHYYDMFLQYFSMMDEMRKQSEAQQFNFQQQQLEQSLNSQYSNIDNRKYFDDNRVDNGGGNICYDQITSPSLSSLLPPMKQRIVKSTRKRILISVFDPQSDHEQRESYGQTTTVIDDDDDDDYDKKVYENCKKFKSYNSRNRKKRR